MLTSGTAASVRTTSELPQAATHPALQVVRPRILAVTMLDGASTTALRRAARWAELFQATLHVLHVLPSTLQAATGLARRDGTGLHDPLGGPLDRYLETLETTHRWVEERLGCELPAAQLHLAEGPLEEQIAAVASSLDAAFIILGQDDQKGNGVLRPRLATQIVRKNQIPVLIARSESLARRMLAATDLTDPAYPTLAYASALAGRSGAKMAFMHHVEHASTAFLMRRDLPARGSLQECDLPTLVTQRAEEHLERLTMLFGEHTETIVTYRGDVINTIIQVAENQAADLIVVGAHDESSTSRLPTGGVSYAVARRAPCSVLVVPLAAN